MSKKHEDEVIGSLGLLAGLACIVGGVALLNFPAGLILVGIFLVLISLLVCCVRTES
jgi:hypothetical protein